jgi:tetratricopeptide (TPR) repeat protein
MLALLNPHRTQYPEGAMRPLLLAAVLFGFAPMLAAQAPANAATPDDLAKAHNALEHDRPDEAIAILQRLAAAQSPVKGVQHELGLAYYSSGNLMRAKQSFEQAVQQDASDLESVQLVGLTLYRLGQPAAAIPYLERVRGWMPNANADANYVLGLCYLDAQRYDDARHAFAAQFSEGPDSAEAYLLLGTMLMHADRSDLAAEQAQKALKISPGLPLAHFMLGEVALLKSNIDEAISELEAERRINPGYAPLYDRLGDAYLHVDKMAEAQQALTKAIALDRSNTGPFILMGEALLRRQDARTATMYLKHAEKMDPSNYVTHTLLAQAYHRSGQEDDAKRETDIASKIHVANQLKFEPMK